MQETPLILSEYEEINSILYKPIIVTQRIKYTCFNVSVNYIVLGSTSGSVYLFTREQCIFQQLIPLSEGPVTLLLISPDEKSLALATKRGSICVINLKPSVKLLSISNEHVGGTVTSLCWNAKSTEIYVGDDGGKISTIVLSIFTVNGMFQAPSCALMHLDSSIVQMDYSLHYLLVSTLTRCYICDTAQEQFKQIGNKARDGEFGACFYRNTCERDKKSPTALTDDDIDDKVSNITGGFNAIIGLNDNTVEEKNLTIYCSRPGCRLWQVTVTGLVVKTHQFKEALTIPSSLIYQASAIKSLQRTITHENNGQTINFSRLFVICQKYLLSYTSTGLYIIDPVNAVVILWTELTNIFMIHIVDEKIYLMTDSGIFHCLTLSSVNSLIVNFFNKKLYNDSLQVCSLYRSELLKSITQTNNTEIDFNNIENNDDIVILLETIISALQPNFNAQPRRLNSGIVVVNSGNGKKININNCTTNLHNVDREESTSDSEIVCKDTRKMEKITCLNGSDGIINSFKNINSNDCDDNDEMKTKKFQDKILRIQSDLEPVNILIGTLKSSMTVKEIQEIIYKISKIINDVNMKYASNNDIQILLYEVVRSIERHYFHSLLENISHDLLSTMENIPILNEIIRAFVDINTLNHVECSCGFPKVRNIPLIEPKFYETGGLLIERSMKDHEKCVFLCRNVPYMWRNYLPIYLTNGGHLYDYLIRLCLQTRDNIVLSSVLPLLDDKQWEIVVDCKKKIQTGCCLACNKKFDKSSLKTDVIIDWGAIGMEIMKKHGPDVAVKFFFHIQSMAIDVQLSESVYQSLIFTKLLHHHGLNKTVEFHQDNKLGNKERSSLCSIEAKKQLLEALEKDLERPVNENIFGNGPHHWGIKFQNPKASACPCCTLSLQTPVLLGKNGISIFPCSHAYHVKCLIEKKVTKCFLHS